MEPTGPGGFEIYRITIVGAIAVIVVAVVAGVLFTGNNPDAERLAALTSIIAPTVLGLLALLRTDTTSNKVDKVKDAVNGHLQAHDMLMREHYRLMRAVTGRPSVLDPNPEPPAPPAEPPRHA